MRNIFKHDERGATAVMVAGAMLFLFGAAALAVDTSIFYGDARTDQNTADFACLAGVAEDDSDDKIEMAAEFTRQNWPTMQGQTVTISGTTGTMSDGTSQVLYTTFVDGEEGRMRVRVLETADTNFARAIGAGP
jgi:Flp pilus assembly protein TadG